MVYLRLEALKWAAVEEEVVVRQTKLSRQYLNSRQSVYFSVSYSEPADCASFCRSYNAKDCDGLFLHQVQLSRTLRTFFSWERYDFHDREKCRRSQIATDKCFPRHNYDSRKSGQRPYEAQAGLGDHRKTGKYCEQVGRQRLGH